MSPSLNQIITIYIEPNSPIPVKLSVRLACWKFAVFQRFDYFCGPLFTIHETHSWKKKHSLFLTKTVRLASVIFWISAFFSAVSCKISLLLPHQCPYFILKLLNFTSTTNYPNLCKVSDTQTLWNSLHHCDFLGCEKKSTTKLMPPLWGRDANVRPLWISIIKIN